MKRIIFYLLTMLLVVTSLSFSDKSANSEKKVLISTDLGDIKVKLYDETPIHRDNFLKLAKEGYLNGTLFHRVIKNFMIQGGDPDSKTAKPGQILGNGGPGYDLPAEFVAKYFHKKGALAAARENDMVNPEKKSSGSQFYIVQGQVFNDATLNSIENSYKKKFTKEQREFYKKTGGSPHLDGDYTVFGEVYEGLDVLDKIAGVAVDKNNRPLEDIKMKVSIIEE